MKVKSSKLRKKKVITICSSASHYKEAIEIANQLKKYGFTVVLPKTAHVMKRTGNFDVSTYKTWFNDKNAYKKKQQLMVGHFKKVIKGDAILVTNFEKNGMQGYIGGNALMEILVAFLHKKPIFILNPISEDLGIKEEVYGLFPKFIDGELTQIVI